MALPFNRALILAPARYSLFNSFVKILKTCCDEVTGFDVAGKLSAQQLKFNSQVFRFPNKIRSNWENYFLLKVNKLIVEEYDKVKPDLVLVYNSEYLLPETCQYIKKTSKLIFFMGDSPFYTPANNYYLTLLPYADLVLCPDSLWIEQLKMIGIKKIAYFIPTMVPDFYYPLNDKLTDKTTEETEVLYVGASYVNAWGYKKAMLMNEFSSFNFQLYGSETWKRWFRFFPELEKNFVLSKYIKTEKLNAMFNKTKLVPVDGNPAIINGIHLRAFEALGSGALPLIEYRKDVDEIIFKDFGSELPVIHNYTNAKEVAKYYLKNDAERKDLACKMKEFIINKYSPQNNSDLIMKELGTFQK